MESRHLMFTALAVALFSPAALAEYGDASSAVRSRSQMIDAMIQKGWETHSVKPSTKVSDKIFMRRIFLDVAGVIPTGQQAMSFGKTKGSKKRRQLIDMLLASDGYTNHYYNYWADILRIKSRIGQVEYNGYIEWLKSSLRENKPYDQFVFELLSAEGRIWENGAAGYYLRDNGMPLDNTSNTLAIFLGTQIGCAQCHDHPFDHWTQKQFYEIASFTHSITTRGLPSGKNGAYGQVRKKVNTEMAKRDLSPEDRRIVNRFIGINAWMVQDVPNRKLRFPKNYQYGDVKPGAVVTPKTIFGEDAKIAVGQAPRQVLAKWVASPKNPWFAKTIANRLWKKVFGVGLIEPVDDIEGKKATNPELLEFLTAEVVRMKFDVKEYLRMLYNTDLYSRRAVSKEIDESAYYFPGPTLRRMSAEQLWDSLVILTMDDPLTGKYQELNPQRYVPVALEDLSPAEIVDLGLESRDPRPKMMMSSPAAKKAGPKLYLAAEMRQPSAASHFLRDFGQSDRNLVESSNTQPTVTQILTLLNGRHHYQILRSGSELSENLKRVEKNPGYRARVVYLSILGR